MAIYVNDRFFNNRALPLEAKYLNSGGTYYANVAEVNTTIISEYRFRGLTVLLPDGEYWYKDGTTDSDLVKKESDITTTGISGATNGLYKDGQTAKLGGGLIENTTISGLTTNDLTFLGGDVKYGGDYRSTYEEYSLVDAGYVTGITDGLLTCGDFDTYTGDTDTCLTNIDTCLTGKQDCITGNVNEVIVHSGSEPAAQSGFLFDISNNSLITDGANNTYDSNRTTILSSTVVDATGAANSAIIAANNINATGSTYDNTLSTNELAIWGIQGTGSLVVQDATTKKLCLTSLETIGGISGATNGLGTTGQDVCLGGDLDNDTIVDGISANSMIFNNMSAFTVKSVNGGDILLDGENSGGVYIRSQTGNTTSGWNDSVGIAADYNNGFIIFDNRVGAEQYGIKYNEDYSENYDDRSLVDKAYVNKIVTGLQPKAAAWVATTTGITLSGLQTIDGVSVANGDRVLVKNQTDKTENGIYIATGGTWSRSDDFDFTPEGEIAQGDLVPVISGDTLANTSWILITDDPISGGTEIEFSLFSRLLSINGGNGINVETVSGSKTASIDLLDIGSALVVDSAGLRVDSSIAGDALTWDTGVLNVKAISGGSSTTDVAIKRDENDNLVVNPDDINACLGNSIVSAENGLTKQGDTVVLGGTLTGNTIVAGASTYDLSFNGLNSFNLGFDSQSIITDNRTAGNQKGLEYAENYSDDFDDCSLITKFYVDCAITAATDGAVYTAANGLTKVDDTVVLGGNLTGNTKITSSGFGIAFGYCVNSTGDGSFAIGSGDPDYGDNIASGCFSFVGGFGYYGSCAISAGSFAFGYDVKAYEPHSHAEGKCSYSCGSWAHAEGEETIAKGCGSHSEGYATLANCNFSHAEGCCTVANVIASHVSGVYNCGCTDTILEVGVGSNNSNRCNALEIKTDGSILTPEISTGTSTQMIYFDSTTGELLAGDNFNGADSVLANNGITKVGDTIVLGGANALTGNTLIKSGGYGLAFGNNTGVTATYDSSFAFGYICDNSTIESNYKGTFAGGYAYCNSSIIAQAYGDVAFGYTYKNSKIGSYGIGSFAGGKAHCNSSIIAQGFGGVAFGYTYENSKICADGTGSFAGGNSFTSGSITSRNIGSFAFGTANDGNLSSNKTSSFAGGYAHSANVCSDGEASFAFGTNVCALEDQSVAFGLCTVSSGEDAKFVIGKYNETKTNAILEVGIGTGTGDTKNALEVYTDGKVAIPQAPPTGTTTDAVLVWNNSDKYIKQIDAGNLGEDNNSYSITSISSNYTALSTDYVIIVDTSSNAVTVTLPSSPVTGQAYKIKDAGNGYTNNITVSGNGNNVDDNGSALINTDYGALELVYNGTQWYSLAFIN